MILFQLKNDGENSQRQFEMNRLDRWQLNSINLQK